MNFGIYCILDDEKTGNYLLPTDLINALPNLTFSVPNWLGYQAKLKRFKNIKYLKTHEFFSLENYFVFIDDESLLPSPWMMQKNICFIIQSLNARFTEIADVQQRIENSIYEIMPQKNVSFINPFYKKLNTPFDSHFVKHPAKYRNCYIINDSFISKLNDFDYDSSLDFVIPYISNADQKTHYEEQSEMMISPSSILGSFHQALLAEHIFIEPDIYDIQILGKILKELAFSKTNIFTNHPVLKKILDLGYSKDV